MPGHRGETKGEPAGGGGQPVSADQDAVNKGIDKMYKIYEKLSSATEKTTLEGDFKELLEAVKRSDKEKRLASMFITRFLEFFPLLYDDAINAMLDLCEDDDVVIRKQVVKDLVTVCKKVPTFVPKIADVFSQLIQTDDTAEQAGLERCLVSLFHIDAQAAVVGIFSQVGNGDDTVRDRCLKFLATELKGLSPEIVSPEFEKCLISEARKCAPKLSGEHFNHFHRLLMNTKTLQTVSGQQVMVDLIAEILEMDKQFDASEAENFDKLLLCTKSSLSSFSKQVSSSAYLVYYCTKVLPNLEDSVVLQDGGHLKLEALRMLADVGFHAAQFDPTQAKLCLEQVYKHLVDLMPTPPEEDELNPKFEFSLIEPLLFTFHKLGGFYPEFLNEQPDRLKEFRARLQYLARGTQTYMKLLREDLDGKRGPELRNDETMKKIQALKLTSNISAVIKDLFHTPPSYKSVVGLSWRPYGLRAKRAGETPALTPNNNRGVAEVSSPSNPKQSRNENRGALYQPPSGKFSARAGTYATAGPRVLRGGIRPRGGMAFPGGGGFNGRRGGNNIRGGRGRY
ncbi:apoptosis inhibitor 5 [Folsomia candida]|uniref:apoptosis inhibitor 5 n=1 Tax=Folsomia candida TaxID=158441 RepID=UPI000B8F6DBD|nr:apoptosis inhibitor 5 [Folsomia candida]